MNKQCFKCGETKSQDQFYAHPKMGDGLLGKCKDCTKRDVRRHRIEHPEKVRAYDRERAKRPERLAGSLARLRIERERHPNRDRARRAVARALRSGKLSKSKCAFCGSGERLEAHHHDYSKPLDVTWLCSGCHARFHALERMATYGREEAA